MYNKDWYDKNKLHMVAYRKEYYLKNREKYRKARLKEDPKCLGYDQERRLLYGAKFRANLHGLEFNLVKEDIIIPDVCKFLGIKLTNISGEGRIFSNASLDRIDSSKGYTKDNVQVISDLANRMKQEATNEQLVTFAQNILRMNGEL